jgi:hypothetical protein
MINTVICVKCGNEMRFKNAGVLVLFTNNGGKPERAAYSDLYRCEKCGNDIITGFGDDIPIQSLAEVIDMEGKTGSKIYKVRMICSKTV